MGGPTQMIPGSSCNLELRSGVGRRRVARPRRERGGLRGLRRALDRALERPRLDRRRALPQLHGRERVRRVEHVRHSREVKGYSVWF